jgi:hypothetical protein
MVDLPDADRPVNQMVKPGCLRSVVRSARDSDACQVMLLSSCEYGWRGMAGHLTLPFWKFGGVLGVDARVNMMGGECRLEGEYCSSGLTVEGSCRLRCLVGRARVVILEKPRTLLARMTCCCAASTGISPSLPLLFMSWDGMRHLLAATKGA